VKPESEVPEQPSICTVTVGDEFKPCEYLDLNESVDLDNNVNLGQENPQGRKNDLEIVSDAIDSPYYPFQASPSP
jgi:hypothetical protein